MKILRKIHRWGGLLMVGFIIFYCFTGVFMNHRKFFDYFLDRHKTTQLVPVTDPAPLREVIAVYSKMVDEEEPPTVVKIKGNDTVELLYGSHGVVTYVIHPSEGRMEKIVKSPNNPWHFLSRLHKAHKTSDFWLIGTDIAATVIMIVTISGLLIFRYKPLDIALVAAGAVLLALGLVIG